MPVRRKPLALSIAVLVAVVVGVFALAQGGEDAADVSPDAVAEAAKRTASVDGMRYSVAGETEVPGAARLPFKGSGVSDLKGQRGTAKIDMSAFAKQAAAQGGPSDPADW